MSSKVTRCTVDSCQYYEKDSCDAPSIEVNPMQSAGHAKESPDTMCKTFQPK